MPGKGKKKIKKKKKKKQETNGTKLIQITNATFKFHSQMMST